MDVLTFLKDEHDEAKQVFKKLEDAEGASAGRLWDQLKNMLTLHEELEETFFYPQLKEEKNTEDLILESYQEHHVMDVLIEEISELKPSDETWQPKIKVLQEIIRILVPIKSAIDHAHDTAEKSGLTNRKSTPVGAK